eukprot:TRINITY_DN10317_c0_g1_i1.p1 TRINITY_DN10317_c0_g1~~TRINITY_DN10317_c0_g1_i1.p1  ORF type:complete len:450 (+),score=91.41 TRINITY_DN10317_c0_g1_i1:97-1350(+)
MKSFFSVLALAGTVSSLDNGLAKTPPMGWSSWNAYACNVTQKNMQDAANSMVSLGLHEVGYEFVNIDDCWMAKERNAAGELAPAPGQFTDMKALGDYIHSKGLKYGIYESSGGMTCQQRAGTLQNETCCENRDAKQWATWGVDYVKFDNCFAYPPWWPVSQPQNETQRGIRYSRMRDAIAASGRKMVFSICAPPNKLDPEVGDWAADVGNLWRVTGDIVASWGDIRNMWKAGDERAKYAGPGAWNDLDMLEIGNAHMTISQQKSHFAWWSAYKSPLILGTDLSALSSDSLAIIKSKGVISVSQDPLGKAARCVRLDNQAPIITGPLVNNSYVALISNLSPKSDSFTLKLSDVGLPAGTTASVTDLWSGKFVKTISGDSQWTVEQDDTLVLKITPTSGSPVDYPEHFLGSADSPCYSS